MTEKQIRQKIAETALSYLGCKESDGSHKKIIDLYNSHTPRARGYKVTYTDAWCATFVSAIAIKLDYTDIMPTECSCTKMIQLYKNIGRWHEADNYKPEVGDIVMYDWNDTGRGENIGTPEHVGIVISANGENFKVLEGNYNNAVKERPMSVNGRYIRGYCLPDYASKATPEAPETPVAQTKVNKGDTVSVAKGAKWVDGRNVPDWVIDEKWIVHSVSGDRVVIDKSVSGKFSIESPIDAKYLTVLQPESKVDPDQKIDGARSYNESKAGKYKVKAKDGLRLRSGASTSHSIIETMPNGTIVTCYGYFTKEWLYVISAKGNIGFCHSDYLTKL